MSPFGITLPYLCCRQTLIAKEQQYDYCKNKRDRAKPKGQEVDFNGHKFGTHWLHSLYSVRDRFMEANVCISICFMPVLPNWYGNTCKDILYYRQKEFSRLYRIYNSASVHCRGIKYIRT